ncbi:ribonuclease E inhibitor RraA/Dimethylmenaquinone methyltransferase [Emericellopsis atlantica]|uniref:Ribonuclease E inhibitor RraA/Dimethylmenaquinone methyltransferase n=1 Tax=Emericellopsis atlantica TaxID=2614577 RepID=A0A9P7ZI37_9HYPO|nr:ribonuclease E inhibitor RraA/Dimethylmenaquinone methyltransferase [Emericellopsis atlantica]KAG9252548.1 ribonuclease E inhibitor RraA/Dimethylmenaquinone methyltransferase [Emericellopsis atlantica]
MATKDPIVEALKEFTTCDVSDALQKLKDPEVRNGGFLSGLSNWSPTRQQEDTKIVGPLYTVKYSPLDDPAPKLAKHYIDSVPEGAVIFISSPRVPNAVYGGLMTARAKYQKAAGTIVDGRFRDLQEQRDQAWPLWARDVGTAAPGEVVKVTGVNVLVELQSGEDQKGIRIHPGDYAIADMNGVVVLPRRLAEQALPLMRKQVEADTNMAKALAEGMTFDEAGKKFR